MDKYGLKAAAIPSMLLMGIAFSLLSLVKGSISLAAVALVFGVGNGFCGGILNAFATGLAPKNARTQFLGLWILGDVSIDIYRCCSLCIAGICEGWES